MYILLQGLKGFCVTNFCNWKGNYKMTYTFAKVLNELSPILSTETFSKDEVIEMLQRLQKEYAPTIEMTNNQAMYISEKQNSVVETLADLEGWEIWNDFDEGFWAPLSQRGVVSAWLHPETIKVVDE